MLVLQKLNFFVELLTFLMVYGKIIEEVIFLKNKSFFSQIILLVMLSIICVIFTVGIALFAGSFNTTLFDFQNLNFANMIPVLILGGFISCVVVGITVLFVTRAVFLKVKDYFVETKENNGGNEK